MAIDNRLVGSRIKQKRTDRKFSQDDLGDIVHVSGRHIRSIENGDKAPSLEILIAIANALDVSADDLLQDNLTHSTTQGSKEVNDLLQDCSSDERAMLTRTLKFLKNLFSEFGIR